MPKYRTRRGLLFLLLTLILFSLSATGVHRGEGLRQVLITLSSLPLEALTWVYNKGSDLVAHYLLLVEVARENERLREEVRRLRLEVQVLSEEAKEAERLRKILELKETIGLRVIPARVIGLSPNPQSRAFFIDRGMKDGLRKGMAVVSGDGVVGRIGVVAPSSSLVIPIVEQGMRVSVLLEDSRTRGVLEGKGWSCKLLYVPREEGVREGHRVVTSGLDGVFPKGLWVGEVKKVERPPGKIFLEVEVRPYVDFSRLEEVLVVIQG